jgi:hypothetical protein
MRSEGWSETPPYKNSALWAQAGAGGSILRTAESNLLDYSMISKRIWKKWSKHASTISIGWQPFPNENSTFRDGLKQSTGSATAVEIRFSFGARANHACKRLDVST